MHGSKLRRCQTWPSGSRNLHVPKPDKAAPKCARTGERALLISLFTGSWALMYMFPIHAPIPATKTLGITQIGVNTRTATSLTSIEIEVSITIEKNIAMGPSTDRNQKSTDELKSGERTCPYILSTSHDDTTNGRSIEPSKRELA